MTERALVLFSGGQDSATCLAWALERFDLVETIGFDYGQRHRIELDCRGPLLEGLRDAFPRWRARLGQDHLLDMRVLGQISGTALTDDRAIAFEASGLPNTFVPDCRDDTLKALQVSMSLGMDTRFRLETPLMWLDKAGTWALAEALGGVALVELIRTHSHSCYAGDRTQLHDWGYGCDTCPACALRSRGWAAYRQATDR